MSSRFKEFRYWRFLFHNIGGLRSPAMAHVNTTLWPTVTVVTLTSWPSGRVSRYTSVGGEERKITQKSVRLSPKGAMVKVWPELSMGCEEVTVVTLRHRRLYIVLQRLVACKWHSKHKSVWQVYWFKCYAYLLHLLRLLSQSKLWESILNFSK